MGDPSLISGRYRLTRIETISTGEINENKVGYSNEDPGSHYQLALGDILFSNINSLPYIGNVALYRIPTGLFHGINLLKLRANDSTVPEFLFQMLRSGEKRNWARKHANPAVSQASINQSLLAKEPIEVCGIEEQQQIAKFLSRFDHLITLHQRKHDQHYVLAR